MEEGDGDAGGGAVEVGAEVEAEDVGHCQITYPHNKYPPPGVGGCCRKPAPEQRHSSVGICRISLFKSLELLFIT